MPVVVPALVPLTFFSFCALRDNVLIYRDYDKIQRIPTSAAHLNVLLTRPLNVFLRRSSTFRGRISRTFKCLCVRGDFVLRNDLFVISSSGDFDRFTKISMRFHAQKCSIPKRFAVFRAQNATYNAFRRPCECVTLMSRTRF